MPRYEMPSPLTLERLEQMLRNHPAFTDPRVVVGDATINVTAEKHSDRNLILGSTAGTTATLPKASGTGDKYRFTIGTLATGNSHIIKCGSTSDVMVGAVSIIEDTSGLNTGFATTSTSDTITMNRSTTGSVTKGEFVEVEDIANNTWAVRGVLTNSSAAATPFSSTVN